MKNIDPHPFDVKEASEKYKNGWTTSELSEYYGITPRTLRRIFLANDIEIRSRKQNYDVLRERKLKRLGFSLPVAVKMYWDDVCSLKDIGNHYGVSGAIIRAHFAYCRVPVRSFQEGKELSRRQKKNRAIGSRNGNWKGGTTVDDGYIRITAGPDYGRREHQVIAEKMIGRPLRAYEVVHHIDGNKSNNAPKNLLVCSRKKHAQIHEFGGKNNENQCCIA